MPARLTKLAMKITLTRGLMRSSTPRCEATFTRWPWPWAFRSLQLLPVKALRERATPEGCQSCSVVVVAVANGRKI